MIWSYGSRPILKGGSKMSKDIKTEVIKELVDLAERRDAILKIISDYLKSWHLSAEEIKKLKYDEPSEMFKAINRANQYNKEWNKRGE